MAKSKADEVDQVDASKAAGPAVSSETEVIDPNTEALLAKLAAAEKRAEEAEKRLAEDEIESAGLRVKRGEIPYAGESGGYKFEVGPVNVDKFPHLKRLTVNAIDETEAVRWYCLTQEHPPNSGKRVDPVAVRMHCECKDRKRVDLIQHKNRLAGIRKKLESGAALSPDDSAILAKHEPEILGYSLE